MSIDYILKKVQDPEASSRDLTSHILYYFRQLSGQSGFPIDERNLPSIIQIVGAIVQHPSWKYDYSVGHLTSGFYNSGLEHLFFSTAQQQKHAIAFEIFLDAVTTSQRQQFVQDHLQLLQKLGAAHIPCVMAIILTEEIGDEQPAIAVRRKI